MRAFPDLYETRRPAVVLRGRPGPLDGGEHRPPSGLQGVVSSLGPVTCQVASPERPCPDCETLSLISKRDRLCKVRRCKL